MTSPFFSINSSDSSVKNFLKNCSDAEVLVRVLDGSKMESVSGVFSEFSRQFQFPSYFGHNWAALHECIGDLDWLPLSKGIIIIISNPDCVLTRSESALPVFVRSMEFAYEDWATPVTDGEEWDRPAVPFSVILQLGRMDDLHRWESAGACVGHLPILTEWKFPK